MDDFYTLMQFARRCAVFALRDRDRDHLVDGVTAIAMIDPRRIDRRDVFPVLALLRYAARTIGARPAALFATAAALAEPEMRDGIAHFSARSDRGIREWGYAAVETPAGPGFVSCGYDPYDPTLPLDGVALALAEALGADDYERGGVSIAEKLPEYWLSGVDDDALDDARSSIRAAVTIHAGLRPGVGADGDHTSRGIVVFLVEVADASRAATLLRLAEAQRGLPPEVALLGVRAGALFCLTVARSFVNGVPGVETPATLQRFAPRFADILSTPKQAPRLGE